MKNILIKTFAFGLLAMSLSFCGKKNSSNNNRARNCVGPNCNNNYNPYYNNYNGGNNGYNNGYTGGNNGYTGGVNAFSQYRGQWNNPYGMNHAFQDICGSSYCDYNYVGEVSYGGVPCYGYQVNGAQLGLGVNVGNVPLYIPKNGHSFRDSGLNVGFHAGIEVIFGF